MSDPDSLVMHVCHVLQEAREARRAEARAAEKAAASSKRPFNVPPLALPNDGLQKSVGSSPRSLGGGIDSTSTSSPRSLYGTGTSTFAANRLNSPGGGLSSSFPSPLSTSSEAHLGASPPRSLYKNGSSLAMSMTPRQRAALGLEASALEARRSSVFHVSGAAAPASGTGVMTAGGHFALPSIMRQQGTKQGSRKNP